MKLNVTKKETLDAQAEQQAIQDEITQLQAFLDSTDYLVVRQMEMGISYPDEVKQKRQAARERISELRQVYTNA